jgi:3-oxoadipate enol-lactonase
VLAGDQDYTPVAFKQQYTSMMKHAELVVIDDARHFAPIERPGPFNDALLAFLNRLRRQSPAHAVNLTAR